MVVYYDVFLGGAMADGFMMFWGGFIFSWMLHTGASGILFLDSVGFLF